MRTLAAATLLPLAFVVPALAATPENGTVSAASPSVKWEGTAPGYGVFPTNLALTGAGQAPAPCEAPYCDTFALKVADKADLTVTAAIRAEDNFTELRVIKPDGELVFVQSAQGEAARSRIKAAAPGDYTVQVITNEPAIASGAYDASAVLAVPAGPSGEGTSAPPADPPQSNPVVPQQGSQQQQQPQTQPQSGPAPAATLGLRTRKVSARKKRFKLAVTSTRPVTRVKLVIKKGKKIVGRGALKSLGAKGKIAVKVKRRLKRGTYTVAVTAREGDRTVGLATKLKVTR